MTGGCASCGLCFSTPSEQKEETPPMADYKQPQQVTTDALATLGTIIDETQGRDAIHLAVENVVAAEKLFPGQDVGFVDDGVGVCKKPVGIVDPFLKGPVFPGQRFWLVVYPRQITSLRHVWEHPAFPPAVEPSFESASPEPESKPEEVIDVIAQSRKWIEDWAISIPLDYDVVMEGARDMVNSRRRGSWGEYLCFGGLLEGEYVPAEFWNHYEVVTGETVAEEHRESFFTCSC
ncbi:hypothetical protein PHIM7_137 [Sinorhizobium phage phiM7]|uniref:Uncharacterized protein n=2 Tax=Emdodecavirus TaxID=1980937 RepID=S5MB28_9CAUD|nr:hypothetical protein AB690_gp360 [Sinorhizobium phage phiM12]YP_009601262.1 hypothetical protein FDH46_gp341 [Sinorhizobium phage phiM7]AGR47833.2 hypothetical protein SmphiM12_201 [Sinorhizobium phage phiM12]AKF12683.1 hypothetical protein PHIM7_137 [Sinorhizobium phage phiM7]AKF13042.1 hypothetical protein PHIM19_137 [Sinorhizobium phage phiM19]